MHKERAPLFYLQSNLVDVFKNRMKWKDITTILILNKENQIITVNI